MSEKQRQCVSSGMGMGLVFVAAGLLLLLGNLGTGLDITFAKYWPSLIILVGVVKILHRRDFNHLFWGGMLVVVGTLFQLNNLDVISFWFGDLWPLAIIFVGMFIIVGSFRGPRHWCRGEKTTESTWHCGMGSGPSRISDDYIKLSRTFDGSKYEISSKHFKGGKIDDVMGGIEVDFRDAEIQGNSAELEVSSVLGSVEMRVPTRWQVVVSGTPVLGSIEDRTTTIDGAEKKLVIKASAVLGSVEIRN